jgi:hypothetical protein
VQSYDDRPKRRLYEVLKAQGMQNNQEVVFLTDGGEDVRELPLYLNVTAEHYLDWFHITMRITVLRQMARCLLDVAEHLEDGPVVTAAQADRELERIKWFLWHGNTFRALQVIDDLRFDLEWEEGAGPEHEAFFKKLTELDGYLNANGAWIPNYGSATAAARRSRPRSRRPPSTRSSASAWSRSNRCAGHRAARTCCSRSAPGSGRHPHRRLPPLVPRLREYRHGRGADPVRGCGVVGCNEWSSGPCARPPASVSRLPADRSLATQALVATAVTPPS